MAVFVIAEAGVNHNGDLDRALRLVDIARVAGANAVKFQTFSADKLVSGSAQKAAYQQRETGVGSQYEMLKRLELDDNAHHRIAEYCAKSGIEFMSTPFDEEAADLLVKLGVKRLKVPSGELVNHTFLGHLARTGLPLVVSTGMGTMEEITEALAVLAAARATAGLGDAPEDFVTLLHCTSNYPAAVDEVNLRAMASIAKATGVPVGYSDHSMGLAVSTAAVALGAVVIEKHFTCDRTLPGPDHKASLEPEELKTLILQIRDVEACLGSPVKAPTESELAVRVLARRSVTARHDLRVGQTLRLEDMVLLRPATGIEPKYIIELAGRKLARDIRAGTSLQWADIV